MHFTKSFVTLSAMYSGVHANPSFRAAETAEDDVQSGILDFLKNVLQSYEKKPEMNIYKFIFSPENAGGVSGQIWMQYEKEVTNPLHAEYKVALDLTGIDLAAIQEKYPDCDYNNIQVTWQLQTQWNNENTSGFLDACAADKTGGSFDPTYACGPFSQNSGGVACNAQADAGMSYQCSPENYAEWGIACEMGDFSGKYGLVSIGGENGLKVEADMVKDYFAPPEKLRTDNWNIGLNLICPASNNPPLLCAKVQVDGDDEQQENDTQMKAMDAQQQAESGDEDCA